MPQILPVGSTARRAAMLARCLAPLAPLRRLVFASLQVLRPPLR